MTSSLLRVALISATLLLLIASLCAPRWGAQAEERETRGADIVIALDVSRSMLADDLHPTRLAAAREAIAALVAALGGDRVGLVAFAGSAFLVCPLTTDYGAFGRTLAETGPDTIPLGGTSLAAALKEGARAFPKGEGGKVLIVVSDGEDQGSEYAQTARELKRQGIPVYCVAAGTPSGALIPQGRGDFFRDREGAVVMSRLNPVPLGEVAAASGGRVVDLTRDALERLYRGDLASLERRGRTSVRQRLTERFQIPLALALALLALEPLLPSRGRS